LRDRSLILPFIVGGRGGKEIFTYPTELARVVCMAELQRRKTGFLRAVPEKISFISKIYYPMWAVPVEDSCLVLDGMASLSHKFTFREPFNIGLFVEDLKKNSVVHQDFMDALNRHAKNFRDFASAVNVSFRALIANRDLLRFLLEYFKKGSFPSGSGDEKIVLIPSEIDEKTAVGTREDVINCWRRIHANVKGLQYALEILNEDVEFHKRMMLYEIERLKEKCEVDVATLKPEVDERVKKLTLKRDITIKNILKDTEKKAGVLEKRREKYVRKLQGIERKKESIRKKIGAFKRRKNAARETYWTYELKKCKREIDDVEKEVRAVSDVTERMKKEGDKNVKEVEEEFRKAIAVEEEKIKQLNSLYESKIGKKKEQIDEMVSETASITGNIGSLTDGMKREASTFREQITIDWKLDETVLVCVPIYMIKYAKENEERCGLFSPMIVSEDVGVLKGLRKILTFAPESRMKLLMRLTSKDLHEMLISSLIGKMRNEEVFRDKISKICQANNLLEWGDFEETLAKGLDEIKEKGWINHEEAMAISKRIKGGEA